MKKIPFLCVSAAGAVGLAVAGTFARADEPAEKPAAAVVGPVQIAAADDAAAAAAATPAASTPDNGAALDAIVVTAQRRSEKLKDVPISISVVSGDDVAAQRIANIEDVSRTMPGLSFNSVGGTEELTNIVIRGVSAPAGAATVGLYLDDVSITTKNFFDPGAAQPKLYDLDHIEVLRGPQGTLWGDSSEGGTVRYVTQQPDLHGFSTTLTTDLSDTKHGGINYVESANINVPIQDGVFAVRGSVGYLHDSGYIDHYLSSGTLTNKGVNTDGTLTLHLVGKLALGSDLTITPALFYQRDVSGDNSAFYLNDPLGSSFKPGIWEQDKEVTEGGTDTVWLPSLTVRKGLSFGDLTSVTGLYVRDYDRQTDGTFYNSYVFAVAFLDPLYPAQTAQNNSIIGTLRSPVEFSSHYRTISQEVRVSSLPEDRAKTHLQWVAGLYYADQWIHNTNFQQIPGIDQAFQSIYGYSLNSPTQSLAYQAYAGSPPVAQLFPDSIDEYDNRTYREQQYAVFGQADYDLLASLHLGLGGRYATSREDFNSTEIGFYQIGNISPYYQTASFEAFTPKATLSYDVDDNSSVYSSVGKGFRLGGATPTPISIAPTGACEITGDLSRIGQTKQPLTFGSDSLWTYELGSKAGFAQNRLQLNAATYLTQWSNIQEQLYLPTCGYYFTTNVGNAKIYGAELEASFRPDSSLKFGLTASAQHAAVTSSNYPSELGVPEGSHLVDVPVATGTASASYIRPINAEFTLRTRADYAWTGHSYGSFQKTLTLLDGSVIPNPGYLNPAYGVLNASVTLAASKYEVALYAKNLTSDQKYIQSPYINTVTEAYTVRPRTIGLTGRYFF
jgi:outer membrane receptor protein involved in Fe transport